MVNTPGPLHSTLGEGERKFHQFAGDHRCLPAFPLERPVPHREYATARNGQKDERALLVDARIVNF